MSVLDKIIESVDGLIDTTNFWYRARIKEIAIPKKDYDLLVLELKQLSAYPYMRGPTYWVNITTRLGRVKITEMEEKIKGA